MHVDETNLPFLMILGMNRASQLVHEEVKVSREHTCDFSSILRLESGVVAEV